MKCIRCGQEITTYGLGTYRCPACGYKLGDSVNDLVYREPLFQPDVAKINYGWICPKCGAVLSPSTKECPYCTPYKVTCGPSSGLPITLVSTSNVTSQAQNSVTATIKGDLQANKNTEDRGNEMC